MHRIQNQEGNLLEDEKALAIQAVDYFNSQFQKGRDATSFSLLDLIPEGIMGEDNANLCKITKLDKVKNLFCIE